MKQFSLTLLAVAFLAGCATTDQYDIRPEAKTDGIPSAVAWQDANRKTLDELTTLDQMKADLKSDAQIAALLDQVKPAYATDPYVATRIAAFSQLSMCTKWPEAPKARERWTAALLKAARNSADSYRTIFFLDQLRWCGLRTQAPAILALGEGSKDKAVRDFAAVVVRELEGKAIGR